MTIDEIISWKREGDEEFNLKHKQLTDRITKAENKGEVCVGAIWSRLMLEVAYAKFNKEIEDALRDVNTKQGFLK